MKALPLILLLAFLAACASAGRANQTMLASFTIRGEPRLREAGFSDAQIETTSRLYLMKCAKCHELHDPAAYDTGEWNSWMKRMSKKAHLTLDESELLTKYAAAVRSGVQPPERPSPAH